MSKGPFYELARRRRRIALLALAARDGASDPFGGRNRAPRVTRATVLRLMAR
ncbi:hypothetical protein [Oceaniglobus trochenteri]|uniref:hypothetical protein n=1 Tax=Oceaniglobus trochenteri TaxID=2763260 RepID=UPI001CFF8549|nr:hypothetical protein [Oceaniglobus trochenteri]